MGLEVARFYDPRGTLLEQWGPDSFVADTPPPTPAWVKSALATENVQSALNCAEQCMQFAAAPVLARGEVAGVNSVFLSAISLPEFARIAGYDVALLVSIQGARKPVPERHLSNWRMRRFQQETRRAMAEARRYGCSGALLFLRLGPV
jgi:hypothetical protein